MYACSEETCYLNFWQNGLDLLRAIAVTRGWNGHRIRVSSQINFGEENYPAASAGIRTHNLSITSPAPLPTGYPSSPWKISTAGQLCNAGFVLQMCVAELCQTVRRNSAKQYELKSGCKGRTQPRDDIYYHKRKVNVVCSPVRKPQFQADFHSVITWHLQRYPSSNLNITVSASFTPSVLFSFVFSQQRVLGWWLMDRFARALVILVFLLIGECNLSGLLWDSPCYRSVLGLCS